MSGNIIEFPKTIDSALLKRPSRKLQDGAIAPAREEVKNELAEDHTSEPIKRIEDIISIVRYLIKSQRYRDNMLFIVGINFGLRVSDLRELRFSNIINDNLTFKDSFPVFEKKTRNTRKKKKNRYITINDAVVEAVSLFLEHNHDVHLDDFMFKSEATNKGDENKPLTARSIDRILKGIAKDLDLNMKVSTHTLRKTFCYHQMLMSNNDPRKLLLLSKMLGHSHPGITMDYIGITGEEIEQAYRELNLGSQAYSYLDSKIEEVEDVV